MTDLYVVTGGFGFIGTHLVNRLSQGALVRVIDDLSTSRAPETFAPGVSFFQESVVGVSPGLFEGAKAVFHLAARPSVPWSWMNADESYQVNFLGTCSVVDAARAAGVERFVFVSSAAVKGALSFLEGEAPRQLVSPYAAHKLMAELRVIRSGLDYAIVRPFNVYGPGQKGGAVHEFVESVKEGRPLKIDGDGTQVRDFIHVRDVVDIVGRAGFHRREKAPKIYDAGTGRPTRVIELASIVAKFSSRPASFEFTGRSPGDPASWALTEPVMEHLGVDPSTDLERGISDFFREGRRG